MKYQRYPYVQQENYFSDPNIEIISQECPILNWLHRWSPLPSAGSLFVLLTPKIHGPFLPLPIAIIPFGCAFPNYSSIPHDSTLPQTRDCLPSLTTADLLPCSPCLDQGLLLNLHIPSLNLHLWSKIPHSLVVSVRQDSWMM